jgi:hypothetical protein
VRVTLHVAPLAVRWSVPESPGPLHAVMCVMPPLPPAQCVPCPGTLTQNKLSLNDPILIGDITAKDLIFHAALASKRDGGQDAIDFCICQALPADDKCVLPYPRMVPLTAYPVLCSYASAFVLRCWFLQGSPERLP